MSQSAVFDYKYMDSVCEESTVFKRNCSLYTALNKPTTTFKDIARWQYEIAEFGLRITQLNKGILLPIDINYVHIDANLNIVAQTLYRPCKDPDRASILMTANSMLTCNTLMLENIYCNNKPIIEAIKIKIFAILSQSVIQANDVQHQSNVVSGAYYTICKLSEMIEGGVIEMMYEACISKDDKYIY